MTAPIHTRLSQRSLKSLLRYDPETGVFTWLVTRSRVAKAGDEAGTLRKDGHVSIAIRGTHYTAQRLAWLYMKGEMPRGRLTFKDKNPTNTAWRNIVDERKTLSDTFSARYQRDLRRRHKAYAAGERYDPDPDLQLNFKRTPPRRKPRNQTAPTPTLEQARTEWKGREE